ncbi:hypothetical protein TESG_08159 [Trichophyton tonsurans CBS 112818]|uniref:Uncharacterized protein n=1 Tax=Trichophyton tonsurans (strain CBS 112818) TaxID=647933 RepID=F2SBA7_TRIT1|nr:hypothetical protein TESG_08159 [Trichophyton tonsurans CBS 112818]
MDDADDLDVERIEYLDKCANYLGKAKVNIDRLIFDNNTSQGQTVDYRHVEHLANVFQNKCDRHLPENFILVKISRDTLSEARELANLYPSDLLKDNLLFSINIPEDAELSVLHGKHRLLAAKQAFWPADRWWGVHFYSNGEKSKENVK